MIVHLEQTREMAVAKHLGLKRIMDVREKCSNLCKKVFLVCTFMVLINASFTAIVLYFEYTPA